MARVRGVKLKELVKNTKTEFAPLFHLVDKGSLHRLVAVSPRRRPASLLPRVNAAQSLHRFAPRVFNEQSPLADAPFLHRLAPQVKVDPMP